MKGSECRLNLIKLTSMLTDKTLTPEGRHVYNLLMSLVELQKIAYADETSRTPRTIQRAYNQAFIFATLYIKLFSSTTKPRSVFGMPFHSLTNHLPEMLRLVNGRSIVAEQAERHFHKLR